MFLLLAVVYAKTSLHFEYQGSQTIMTMSIENTHKIDFQQITQPMQVFSRSFLENLHVAGKASKVYVSTTQGTLQNHPDHGVVVMMNSDANPLIVINQISEIFRIAKHTLIYDPAYSYNLENVTLSYENFNDVHFNSMRFAQDPSDNVCVDSIESIKKYFGCHSERGLGELIDANRLFKSSYISVQGLFEYDGIVAHQKITLTLVFNTEQLTKILSIPEVLQTCPKSIETVSHSQRVPFDLTQAKTLRLGQLAKRIEDKDVIYKPSITHTRFLGGEWFSFQAVLYEVVTANEDGIFEVQLFFPHEFVPIYHTLKVSQKCEIEFKFEGSIKQIFLRGSLNSGQTLQITIKFEKILKAFEEYPHDPERGQDLISTAIIFNRKLYLTQQQVTRQPYPDFSMPFNVLTFSCLILGYYFLQILGMAVDKFEIDKPEKGSIAQRVIRWVTSIITDRFN